MFSSFFTLVSFLASIVSFVTLFVTLRIDRKISNAVERRDLRKDLHDVQNLLQGYLNLCKDQNATLKPNELLITLVRIEEAYRSALSERTLSTLHNTIILVESEQNCSSLFVKALTSLTVNIEKDANKTW